MGWSHKTLAFKENVVLGTEATEWNSMAADEQDASLAQKRLNEASEFAGHVQTVPQLHLDSRKSEALWLMTSKSIARSLDFDAKVVNSKKMKPLAETLEAETKCNCEKLLERALDDDDWTRMKLPTSLGGMGIRAVTSQLEASIGITVKKTRTQADRIEESLTGKQVTWMRLPFSYCLTLPSLLIIHIACMTISTRRARPNKKSDTKTKRLHELGVWDREIRWDGTQNVEHEDRS